MILTGIIIPGLSSGFSGGISAQTSPGHQPLWLGKEPLIIVGNWDSMPLFQIRRGGSPLWGEEQYKKEHTEETVRKLKDLGVTMAVIHFYKGFGLEAEKENLADALTLTNLCKKYGLRVGVYIGSTIGYETFLLEKPEAQEWFVPDYMGQPVRYGGTQTFRKRVYFMHPGYKEYMKEVVRIAVEDFKVDLIHFDNTSMRAQAPVFFHPLATEHFKAFLRNKYSPEELKKRLGFSNLTYVEPPKYSRPLSVINDPLFQEWTDFRCAQLALFYKEMADYIHGMNPEVVVENNPHSGISGRNTMWEQGVDYPRLLAQTNIVWTEEGYSTGINDEGVLVSKIRTYKMARTLHNKIFTYNFSCMTKAEAMAYNRQCLGMIGGVFIDYDLPEDQKNYINFYHDNFNYYRDIKTLSDVAVLRTFATMAFNNDRPYQSTLLFEQALIQSKVPFDIIFDQNLDDLSNYKVLVLADQECLSDEQLDKIRAFVRRGGGLVATGLTSLYTPERRRRRTFGLHDLFKMDTPSWSLLTGEEIVTNTGPVKNTFGSGRIIYLPEVIPAAAKPTASAMTSQYWKLPINRNELIESVRWAAGGHLSVQVKASEYVTVELTGMKDDSAIMLHFVNYGIEKDMEEENITVDAQVPDGRRVEKVLVLSPDENINQNLEYKIQDDRISFTVPKLEAYNLVVISLK